MDNLELTETNGYTITAVYGVGYRLDAVNTTALNRAPAQQHAAATEMLSGSWAAAPAAPAGRAQADDAAGGSDPRQLRISTSFTNLRSIHSHSRIGTSVGSTREPSW